MLVKKIFFLLLSKIKTYFREQQKKWNFKPIDYIIIFFVFSISGLTSLWIRPYIQGFFSNLEIENSLVEKLFGSLIFFITYYVVLLFYGFVTGKHNYFLEISKRPFKRLSKLFKFIRRFFQWLKNKLVSLLFKQT